MATVKENKDFMNSILPLYLLDDALKWIKNSLEPEDVFSVEKLSQWAKDSGFLPKNETV